MLDETLRKAILKMLEQFNREELVDDLLIIEVDWEDTGSSAPDEVTQITFQGRAWPLVFSHSELVVRRAMNQEADKRIILVVRAGSDWRLPADLIARAYHGIPQRLGLRHRLMAITDRDWPQEVDYQDWRPIIAAQQKKIVQLSSKSGTNWTIGRSELEGYLIQAVFGVTIEGHPGAKLLAGLVEAQVREGYAADNLSLSILQIQLRQHAIDHADLLSWAAEKGGRAMALLQTGIMIAAEQSAGMMPNWSGLNPLRSLLVNQRQLSEVEAIRQVTGLTIATLNHLSAELRGKVLEHAEESLGSVLPNNAYNPWFPKLLENEIMRLAAQLVNNETVNEQLIVRLKDHHLADEQQNALSVLRQMWELRHALKNLGEEVRSFTDPGQWIDWYTQTGASVDLSALKLMVAAGHAAFLNESAKKIAEEYWDWRSKCNAQFAMVYLPRYEEALHNLNGQSFGTHRILEWVVRPVMDQGKHVLMLVMDALSYPDFLYLCEQWHSKTQAIYAHPAACALSLLPSVTSVSRKALFLKALPTDRLDDENTYEEKAGTSELQGLQQALAGRRFSLFNKTNFEPGAVLNDLKVSRPDFIAIIWNTIDDDLKNATTVTRLYSLEELGTIVHIIQQALELGWQVLLTADHGHTWHRNRTMRRGEVRQGGGERFCILPDNYPNPIDTVSTQDPLILREAKGQHMALLTASGAYFGHNPRRGYHGGASLEEVVIPCAWLNHFAPVEQPTAKAVEVIPSSSPYQGQVVSYDFKTLLLTLPDGQIKRVELPFELSPTEAKLLQVLARFGEASETQLKTSLGSRRISGPLAALRDRLAAAGLDWIELVNETSEGLVYRFRTELLG